MGTCFGGDGAPAGVLEKEGYQVISQQTLLTVDMAEAAATS